MSLLTGEHTCGMCGERVLVVRDYLTGRLVALDPERTDGGWEPMADSAVGIVAKFRPRDGDRRERMGHRAHTLRCRRDRVAGAPSRERIAEATTEHMPSVMGAGTVTLPLLRASGVRALVGSSS